MSSQTDRGVSGPYVTAQAMEGPPIEKPFWRPNRVFKEIVLQPHAAQAASDGNSPSSLEEGSPGEDEGDVASTLVENP
eukprot:scaffold5136_cov229-Pinguiococcus_pyrenoidosus.AAC.5